MQEITNEQIILESYMNMRTNIKKKLEKVTVFRKENLYCDKTKQNIPITDCFICQFADDCQGYDYARRTKTVEVR